MCLVPCSLGGGLSVWEGSLSKGYLGVSVWGPCGGRESVTQIPHTSNGGHCCGRYASYWNACLFTKKLQFSPRFKQNTKKNFQSKIKSIIVLLWLLAFESIIVRAASSVSWHEEIVPVWSEMDMLILNSLIGSSSFVLPPFPWGQSGFTHFPVVWSAFFLHLLLQ